MLAWYQLLKIQEVIISTYISSKKKHYSSSITGTSSQKIIFEAQAFSSENKKDFKLNILETYQFLAILHKSNVNWRNTWDFWSSLRTKMFNVTLCSSHLKESSIFPSSSYIYLTFLKLNLQISRSSKVAFCNSQIECMPEI